MKDVCLSEPVLWLKGSLQLSSMSQAWTRLLLWWGLIQLDWNYTIMNFVWHFPYSAPHPVAQASAKHRPEGYRFSIHAYAGWVSVNIQQNQFGCLQESTMWANCPGFLLLPGKAGVLERGVIRPHSNLLNGFVLEKISFFFVYVCMECLWLTLHQRCHSAKSIHENSRRMGQLAGFLQGHMLLSKSSKLTLQLKQAACLLCEVFQPFSKYCSYPQLI